MLRLIVVDVRPLALGEPLHERRLGTATEQDDGQVASRSPPTRSGDPLFNDFTAKVGVDLALFGPSNSLTQGCIRDPFLAGKALKPSGFEDSGPFYSTWCQTSRTFAWDLLTFRVPVLSILSCPLPPACASRVTRPPRFPLEVYRSLRV